MDTNNTENNFHCPHCNEVTLRVLDVCPHCGNLIHASSEENKKHKNMLLAHRVLSCAVLISIIAALAAYSAFSPLRYNKTEMREIEYTELTQDTEYNEHAYTDVTFALEYATLEQYIKSGNTTIPSYGSGILTKIYYIALCGGEAETIEQIALEITKSEKDEFDAQLQSHMAEGKPLRVYGTVAKSPENVSTTPSASSLIEELEGSTDPDDISVSLDEQRKQNEESLEYLNSHKILSVDIPAQFEKKVVVGTSLTPGAYLVYGLIGLAIVFFLLSKYVKKRHSDFMTSIAYIP